jgi:hypothetical protein
MAPSAAKRAANAWRRILDKPSRISFVKPRVVAANGTVTPESTLAAQTVRLERDSTAALLGGSAGAAPVMRVVVFGIRGHDSLADTDIEEGYRFAADGDQYRITEVINTIGERQGLAVVIG